MFSFWYTRNWHSFYSFSGINITTFLKEMNFSRDGKHSEHRKNCTSVKWYGDRVERGESCKPAEPATGEMIFPDPVSPKSPPKWGKGNFFPIATKKCQFCFTQEIKDNLNFAPKVFQTTKTNRRLAELVSGCVQRGKPALSSALPARPRTCQRLGKAIACIHISTGGS